MYISSSNHMKIKEFVKNFILFLLTIALLSSILCVIIDPFNVFHPMNVRDNGVEPNKNYIKMKYILSEPEKFDAFLFGSSRVGNIHTDTIPGEMCYNMTYSRGTPSDNVLNIRTIFERGLAPKHIYIGVDQSSYIEDFDGHNESELRSAYEYSKEKPLNFWVKYFNLSSTGTALADIMIPYSIQNRPLGDRYQTVFYNGGWNYDYGFESGVVFDSNDFQLSGYKAMARDYINDETLNDIHFANMEQTLEDIRTIKVLCDEHGTQLTIFTNPVYYELYTEAVSQHYLAFLKELADVTPYYNFSGFNDITVNPANYMDKSHYNAEVGDLIIKTICLDETDQNLLEQGFGMYVDNGNISSLIDILSRGAELCKA